MKFDGKAIAAEIIASLQQRVGELQKNNITPHLTIIVVGEDPAIQAYIRQKQKRAAEIGAKITIFPYETTVTTEILLQKVTELNNDHDVHGIIVQRPLPAHIDKKLLEEAVLPAKDKDGFHPDSPFAVPVAMAVVEILKKTYGMSFRAESEKSSLPVISNEVTNLDLSVTPLPRDDKFLTWLSSQNIVCVGKGDTAGGPIINHLRNMNIQPTVIDTKTLRPIELMQQADILISSVGKTVVTPDTIKEGAILIGVGLHKGEDGKLYGDYDEAAIAEKAAYYTPTPGGVGPVNVAMLMQNLVTATEKLQ